MTNTPIILPDEVVMNQIYVIRDNKVMLDRDLAALYGVETKILNQAVRRNNDRFPTDFMFQLTKEEYDLLRSQIVTLKTRGTHSKYLPHAFTEQGIAMLSSVLNSKQAIQINIRIIRIFSKLKQFLLSNTEVRLEISEIKHALNKLIEKQDGQDKNIELLFRYIDRLQEETNYTTLKDRKSIGFELTGDNHKP